MLIRDGYLLVAARGLRMLSYGFLSVILALYLSVIGFSALQIGTLFTVALGGAAATTVISLLADRWGRRTSLIVSSALMATAGAALATSTRFPLLLAFAALGTLNPSGGWVPHRARPAC